MPEKIFVGNFSKGLTQNREAFVIDNDAFPVLVNAYSWRGRVKRKRGTSLIARLQIQLGSKVFTNTVAGQLTYTLNLVSTFPITPANASITPGSVIITSGSPDIATFTDNGDGTFSVTGLGVALGSSINYLTGIAVIVFSSISLSGGGAISVIASYFPSLPVMGLLDYLPGAVDTLSNQANPAGQYPLLLAFDTVNSYQINQSLTIPYFYNVSYYKNSGAAVSWTGENYQQFWGKNYNGAIWVTNGNPGMQLGYLKGLTATGNILTFSIYSDSSRTVPITNLVENDWIFFNEITATTVTGINGVSGQITDASGSASGIYQVTFSTAILLTGYTSNSGIGQLLTNQLPGSTGDGIRWYDGDPTSGTGLATSTSTGWVNFSPPLSSGDFGFNILSEQIYYLVGAVSIVPFQDRLLFFGPYIQSQSDTSPTQLVDTVIWSWNGTPYYCFPTPNTFSGNAYQPDITAYQTNVAGKGGYLSSATSQAIVSVGRNQDALIVGFTGFQAKLLFTGNNIDPFNFYVINPEFGSSSTFSGIALDRGILTMGAYGISLTTQEGAERIDLSIPDIIFSIQALNHGVRRVNAIRDFANEWIYFTFPSVNSDWVFPTQTLFYNYRDQTWALFYENYTSHGTFRKTVSGLIWKTVGITFPSWEAWNSPWDSSTTTVGFPAVCAGNQQGFVMNLDSGTTSEGESGYIQDISASGLVLTITSPDHCLMDGDFIQLQNILGSTNLNDLIGKVRIDPSNPDENTFDLVLSSGTFSGTYTGGGVFARLSQPFIQTKQFPVYWEEGRQVRLGVQKYLFDRTSAGEVTIQIYLSQDSDDPWNEGPIVPSDVSTNNSLIYSETVSTAFETNNLQTPNPPASMKLWHRMNTSLIGDTFQIGITLSDTQMKDITVATSEIVLQGMIFDVERGPQLV